MDALAEKLKSRKQNTSKNYLKQTYSRHLDKVIQHANVVHERTKEARKLRSFGLHILYLKPDLKNEREK